MSASSTPQPGATNSDRTVAFQATALTKTYQMGQTQVHALRGVDLEIYRGEIVVLLGPYGSGKSTLLNILGGLDRASSGQLLFDGTDLTAASDRELTVFRRHRVGFIFQFYNLIPSLTSRENVTLVTDLVTDPHQRWERLGHGYQVDAAIVLWRSPSALQVPVSALFRDGDRWAVFVVRDDRAALQHVEIYHTNDSVAEVVSGLSEADRVISHPSDRVQAGIRVEARQ